MSFTSIPTIDLALAKDAATRPALLADLRVALTQVGFLYVAGHDVPATTVSDLVDILPALFQLPVEAKTAVALENSPHFLGYSGVGAEHTAGQIDQREQVEFGTELPSLWQPGRPQSDLLVGPNQWPDLDQLRPRVEAYLAALTALGERFLALVAEALGLPDDTFLSYLSEQHRLKVVRYPPPPSPTSSATQQGVGPHKDSSGWWTFLLQASPPSVRGLQVLNKAGDWVDVPAVPGTFVVNIGQAFEVVTGGTCRATTHRVVMPAATSSGGGVERYSVPFFQGVRRSLTRKEAEDLWPYFHERKELFGSGTGVESAEGQAIDSAFLRGPYDTWGEAQLRTKVRSHRENGRRFYADVYDQYIQD